MTHGPDPGSLHLSSISSQLADAVERVGGSLVRVNGRARYPSTGTVHGAELVVTADHTLERDDELTVETPDGRTRPAELAGRDPATDLAVLRVPGLGLEPASRATMPPRVGQLVLAVGRATGDRPEASLGIVSAVGGPLRTRRGALLEQFIRTDAIPYPGFSGGPLIDPTGAVVGVLTTGLVRGVGLAVPAELAARTADILATGRQVPRAYLGVGSQPVRLPAAQRPPGAPGAGLLLVSIAEGGPAAQAGLLLGDIMVALAGRPLAEVEALQVALAEAGVGATIPIELVRGGALTTLMATVGRRQP